MGLPQAVERAGELADKLYAEAYGKPEGESSPAAAAPAAANDQQATQQAPAATPAPAAPPAENFEVKYKTLAGKYNAEVPRFAAENRDLKQTVTTLTEKVDALAAQLEDAKRTPPKPLITAEETAEFGEPLVDMARRAAQEVVQQTAAPATAQMAEVRQELDDLKRSAKNISWQNFIDLLTTLSPEWAQINVDSDFLSWLDGTDDLSGMTRQNLLDVAKDALDAPRVARFFNSWREANQNKAASTQSAMAQHVAPNSESRSEVPAGKPIFTRAQVQRFYADWRSGRITDAQAIATEAEINAAAAEGRIR